MPEDVTDGQRGMLLMSLAADPAAEFRDSARSGAPLPPGPLLGFVIAVAAVAFISLLTYRSLQTRSIAAQRVTTRGGALVDAKSRAGRNSTPAFFWQKAEASLR